MDYHRESQVIPICRTGHIVHSCKNKLLAKMHYHKINLLYINKIIRRYFLLRLIQSIVKDYSCCWRGYVGSWIAGVQKPSGKVIQDIYPDSAEYAVTNTAAMEISIAIQTQNNHYLGDYLEILSSAWALSYAKRSF